MALRCLSDHNASHENWFQGCKIDLTIHQKLCNGYSFSLGFPRFATLLLILMNMQIR